MFCLVNRIAEGIVYMYLASELICQEEIWEGDLERKHIRDKQTPILSFFPFYLSFPRMKIFNISVDISPIYPISVIFDTISTMIDISPIYRFWTDISWKYLVCDTRAR